MQYLNHIINLIKKDIRIEFRSKEAVSAMLVFGLTIIVMFSFAFNLSTTEQREIAPGLLWIAFTFSGILGLNLSFASEIQNGCIRGLLLAPISRSVIYVSKLVTNFLFMFFSELVILLVFIWLFDIGFQNNWLYLGIVIILGTLGFSATGTLFSAISTGTKTNVFFLPILQFPIIVPILIASVEATSSLLTDELSIGYFDWIKLLLGFNIIFITASVMLFEFIVEE